MAQEEADRPQGAAAVLSVTRVRARGDEEAQMVARGFDVGARQLLRATGLVAASLRREDTRTFWTMTLWRGLGALAGYRNDNPHRTWMGNVETLCDESSSRHLAFAGEALPPWPEAEALLAAAPVFTAMAQVSDDQRAGRIPTGGPVGEVHAIAPQPPG